MLNEWQSRFQAWARDMGVDDVSGAELVHWIRMVHAAYTRAIEAHLAPIGLSGPRLRILVFLFMHQALRDDEGISPSLLGRWRGVSKSTMSILLRGLEEEGWITRTVDAQDRRRVRIRLTEKARALIERHAPQHLRFLNELAAVLSPEEREHLTRLLRKLYQGLRERADGPCPPEPLSTLSPSQE